MTKRFDRLDVATTDLDDAAQTYLRNFGMSARAMGPDTASINIGDAEIRLRTGTPVADFLMASGEGLAAIWLEADDLDQAAEALGKAGAKFSAISREGDRRVIAVDPKSANMVSLYIFDRKV
jgi:predicted enzyme related to lactoylglutathione lyase